MIKKAVATRRWPVIWASLWQLTILEPDGMGMYVYPSDVPCTAARVQPSMVWKAEPSPLAHSQLPVSPPNAHLP